MPVSVKYINHDSLKENGVERMVVEAHQFQCLVTSIPFYEVHYDCMHKIRRVFGNATHPKKRGGGGFHGTPNSKSGTKKRE